MKAKTLIHLLDDQRIKSSLGLEELLPVMQRSPGGVVHLEVVKDHGAVRGALVPLSSVVWFEDLR